MLAKPKDSVFCLDFPTVDMDIGPVSVCASQLFTVLMTTWKKKE